MESRKDSPSGVFKVGAIALTFLILGYQVALFVHRAAAERIVANRDRPDTIYIIERVPTDEEFPVGAGGVASADVFCAGPQCDGLGADGSSSGTRNGAVSPGDRKAPVTHGSAGGTVVVRKPAVHSPEARAIAEKRSPRKVESFRFDPNTASVEELVRLGFSEKQALSIDAYRSKGGRFRRKSDFAKSYVVADSVFRRLEPFIDIPQLDINKADSAAFDTLPGIGGWFAAQMVEYRTRLHGYSCPEQLMEIYRFDRERFEALQDLIICSPAAPYPLWSLPADSLRLHPHIMSWQTAKAIVFYREHNPREKWTVDGLLAAGILSPEQASRLHLCRIE